MTNDRQLRPRNGNIMLDEHLNMQQELRDENIPFKEDEDPSDNDLFQPML